MLNKADNRLIPWFRQPSLWLAMALLALDLAAKQWIVSHVPVAVAPVIFLPGLINLTHQTNPGVAFSWLAHLPPQTLLVISGLLQVALLLGWLRSLKMAGLARWGLALGLAGALGNWLDRLADGQVTDYLQFAFWPSFPVMNLADWYLSLGVVVMAIDVLLPRPTQRSPFIPLKPAPRETPRT